MTTFDDREHAFEAHFALEEALEFRAQARRDRMLGLWAGERMGLSGEGLENYALSVMRADLKERGDGDVWSKVTADLAAAGVKVQPHEVRTRMEQFLQQARAEIKAGS